VTENVLPDLKRDPLKLK